MTDDDTKRRSRRDLLKTMALGAAAASTAGLATTAANADVPEGTADEAGYRETDHVRRYYELARE